MNETNKQSFRDRRYALLICLIAIVETCLSQLVCGQRLRIQPPQPIRGAQVRPVPLIDNGFDIVVGEGLDRASQVQVD